VVRLGSTEPTRVDIRVVAATHRALTDAVQAGTFRADLYYRLTAFQVRVPALTERREDIPLLAQHFLDVRLGPPRFEPEALRALGDYLWPGNVRQLKSVVERVALLADGRIDEALVNAELLSEGHGTRPTRASPRARLRALAREILALPIDDKLDAIRRCLEEEALELADGDAAEAAQRLGVTEGELVRSTALHTSTPPPLINDDPEREVV
jgi:DNA-binding NtrC family response regulator